MKKAIVTAVLLTATVLSPAYAQLTNALKIKIMGNGYSDETVFRFKPDAGPEFGTSDAYKLFSINPQVPSLYTESLEGYAMSINAMHSSSMQDTLIDILSLIPAAGNYDFLFTHIGPFDPDVTLSLLIPGQMETVFTSDTTFTLNLAQNLDTNNNTPVFQIRLMKPLDLATSTSTGSLNNICSNATTGTIYYTNQTGSVNVTIKDVMSNTILDVPGFCGSDSLTNMSDGTYYVEYAQGTEQLTDTVVIATDHVIQADFTTSTTHVDIAQNLPVDFFNSTIGGTTYYWDFGDGNTSQLQDPQHLFTSTGTYTVTLDAYNQFCSDQQTIVIEVDNSTNVAESAFANLNMVYSKDQGLVLNTSLVDGTIEAYTLSGQLLQRSIGSAQGMVMPYSADAIIVRIEQHGQYLVKKLIAIQ